MNNGAKGGIGFTGLLQLTFIILKLVGVIKWSWAWVLAPLWICGAIALVAIVIILICCFTPDKETRLKKKKAGKEAKKQNV